jgi:signal transduction histidine kinase
MATRVGLRDVEMRELNLDLERRVERRTTELTEANHRLDQGREEALRLLARERELSELKNDFVALVSHEFRTPLEVIISSADNLQRYHDRLLPEKREQLLRTISRSVRRMSGMMEEVLVLGRVEAGQMQFNPTQFDFRSFCQRLCDEICSATSNRCVVRLTIHAEPDRVRGDEDVLRHILTNLLSNAVKYSAEGETIDFAIEREDLWVIIRITDHGCGIPIADQKRIFQAFHRGSNVRQIPGTGLGLLIVQRCVALHGGEIQFESVQDRGTTFTVRLPLFSNAPTLS